MPELFARAGRIREVGHIGGVMSLLSSAWEMLLGFWATPAGSMISFILLYLLLQLVILPKMGVTT